MIQWIKIHFILKSLGVLCIIYPSTPFPFLPHDSDRWPTFPSCCSHGNFQYSEIVRLTLCFHVPCEIGNVSPLAVGRPAVGKGENGQSVFEQLHLPIPLPHSSCSNCIATVLSSNAWDWTLVNWNETFHRPPSHERNHSPCFTTF